MILIEVRSSDSLCSTEKYTGIVTFGGPAETSEMERHMQGQGVHSYDQRGAPLTSLDSQQER